MSNIIQTEKVSINPQNAPGNGVYSFKNGYPIVQFLIAQSSKYLVGKSVRLTGKIKILDAADAQVRNNDGVGGANAGGGVNATINETIGVASCIQQVTLSTLDHQTLEHIRQMPRLLSSIVSSTHSSPDLNNGTPIGNLTASRSIVEACSLNTTRDFSIPIRCGLLTGAGLIPIGQNGTQGMIVQLELSPDNTVLQPVKTVAAPLTAPYTSTTIAGVSGGNADISQYHYQLSDLQLDYDLLVPDDEGVNAMETASNGQLTYNAYSSLYSVVNASDQQVVLNLGASKVQSVFHNLVPTPWVNNSAEPSNSLFKFANGALYNNSVALNEVAFAKGGILFPLEERVDVEPKLGEVPASPQQPAAVGSSLDAKVIEQYLNSVKPINTLTSTSISLMSEKNKSTRVTFAASDYRSSMDEYGVLDYNVIYGEDRWPTTATDPNNHLFGIGIRQDQFKVGVDYSRTPYSVRIQSGLDGNSPLSLFSYVLATNTLTYSPQGIRVSS